MNLYRYYIMKKIIKGVNMKKTNTIPREWREIQLEYFENRIPGNWLEIPVVYFKNRIPRNWRVITA